MSIVGFYLAYPEFKETTYSFDNISITKLLITLYFIGFILNLLISLVFIAVKVGIKGIFEKENNRLNLSHLIIYLLFFGPIFILGLLSFLGYFYTTIIAV